MASRRNSKKSAGKRGRRKSTEKKTHKWHQRGCQSQSQTGGGSMTGGTPWGPSDVQHQSTNGNHYALNTAT